MGERKVDECHNLLVYLGNLKQVTDHEQGCKTNAMQVYIYIRLYYIKLNIFQYLMFSTEKKYYFVP